MDIFLTTVAIIIIIGLLYAGWGEWRRATQEQKIVMLDTLVAAAQQLYYKDPGSLRFDWVAQRFKDRWPNIDDKELEVLIEAAVYRLRVFAGLIPKAEHTGRDSGIMYWSRRDHRHN